MQSVLKSGPVPWAGYQSIQFLAEQVSHHPPSMLCYFHAVCCDYGLIPVSAIYAECPDKGMYAFGSIQTRSRFLGLSVGVQNIGQSNNSLHRTLLHHNDVT